MVEEFMVAVFIAVKNLCALWQSEQAVQITFQWGCQSSHSFLFSWGFIAEFGSFHSSMQHQFISV
jgi:hypothetical protein